MLTPLSQQQVPLRQILATEACSLIMSNHQEAGDPNESLPQDLDVVWVDNFQTRSCLLLAHWVSTAWETVKGNGAESLLQQAFVEAGFLVAKGRD